MSRQPIKILHLTPSLTVGGAERLLLSLAERLDRSRFEVHVCSLGVVRGNQLQSEFERLALPLYVVGSKRLYDVRSVVGVARYVRSRRIDILHTHQSNADVVGQVVGRLLGRPVVSTMHSVPHNYNRERLYSRWLARMTARYLSTRFIAVSQAVRNAFVREWHIPAERFTTIYNAVPLELYRAIPEGRPDRGTHEGPVIANIGRLGQSKGQHVLLDAAALVLRQRPDARFMIVGQGRLDQQLKEQARALGIADRVIFTGLRHDIPTILAQSDIFVLSSFWEGLPLSAVEAMAAARPVVLTDVGGNRELVEPGAQGLIVPPGDPRALADALLLLSNDEPRRMEMGRAGRARVWRDFNMDTFVAQHEALYEAIWSERRVSAHTGQARWPG